MNWTALIAQRRADGRREAQANGFTLMELLIVIAIILILMLMAIPTIGSLKKKANETSAINSMQVIQKAETLYQSNYGINGYACSLTALGGDPASGAPTATSSQLLQQDLATGDKSGYLFTIGNCTKVTKHGTITINAQIDMNRHGVCAQSHRILDPRHQ